MRVYQRDFLEFAIDIGALRFGEFVLKSGRRSPYFFNAGSFNTGAKLARLGHYYAHAARTYFGQDFMLFGPAYKGIPLVTATAIQLFQGFEHDVAFAFNRKEQKNHGEGGRVVGSRLTGKVLIIDDVITAGLSIDHSISLIRQAKAEPVGVVIALNRQEQAVDNSTSAAQSIEKRYGIPVRAIVDMDTLIEFLDSSVDYHKNSQAVTEYRERYGAPVRT